MLISLVLTLTFAIVVQALEKKKLNKVKKKVVKFLKGLGNLIAFYYMTIGLMFWIFSFLGGLFSKIVGTLVGLGGVLHGI